MPLASKLKDSRKQAGLSQIEMAKALGVTQPYLSQLETGRLLTMPPDLAKKAASVLGLAAGAFDSFVSKQGARATSEVGRHRIIGTVAAGKGIDEADGEETISLPEMCDGADGVYRVKGMSMKNAGILPGDYLVVRKTDNPPNGELAVAWTAGAGAVVKRVRTVPGFYNHGTGFVLLSEGEEDEDDIRYPYTMQMDRGDRFFAVVIAVFRPYKPKDKAAARPGLKPVTPKSGTPAIKPKVKKGG